MRAARQLRIAEVATFVGVLLLVFVVYLVYLSFIEVEAAWDSPVFSDHLGRIAVAFLGAFFLFVAAAAVAHSNKERLSRKMFLVLYVPALVTGTGYLLMTAVLCLWILFMPVEVY